MDNINRRWTTVNRSNPCKICGKHDWCSRTDDGRIAICRRQGSLDQEHRDKNGAVYYVHRADGDLEYSRAFDYLSREEMGPQGGPCQPRRRRKDEVPPEVLDANYWTCLDNAAKRPDHTQQIQRLAERLHVPAAALESLGCVYGFHKHWTFPAKFVLDRWAFPQFDGDGLITGISTRGEDGSKKTVRGGHQGVFLPLGWRSRAEQTGTLYVVEGPSDTAALWAVGLAAVGRPSNTGGGNHLAELLRFLAGRAAMVVVGERDEKPDGRWPGREGAIGTAQGLADALSVAVRVVLPPVGYKDSREWLKAQGPALDDDDAWIEAGRQLESSWETIEPVAPTPRSGTPDLSDLSPEKINPLAERARKEREESEAICQAMYKAGVSCTHARCVQPVRRIFGHGTIPKKYRWIRCKRWCCPGCLHWNIARTMENVRARLGKHVRSGGKLFLVGTSERSSRAAILKAIQRKHGEHFAVQAGGQYLFVSKIELHGSKQSSTDEAAREIENRLSRWHKGCRGRPISSSRNWKAPKLKKPATEDKIIGTVHKDVTPELAEQFVAEAGFYADPLPMGDLSIRRGIMSGHKLKANLDAMLVRPGGLEQAGAHLIWMLETATFISAEAFDQICLVAKSPDNFAMTGDFATDEGDEDGFVLEPTFATPWG